MVHFLVKWDAICGIFPGKVDGICGTFPSKVDSDMWYIS